MDDLIAGTIIGIAVTSALAFLNKTASNRTSINQAGWFELRMNRLYQVVGILAGVMGLSFLFLLDNEQNSTAFITILVISLGFAALGFICWLWHFNHQLSFNKQSISVSNVYGKWHSIEWKDISEIKFHSFSGLISVTDKHGKTVKIHQHLVGFNTFVGFMERETKWTANELKLPITKK